MAAPARPSRDDRLVMETPWGHVRLADYGDAADGRAIVELLDAYARDPAGGGEPLSAHTKSNLVTALAQRPAFSVLAFAGSEPIGLVNCLEGFSTFACQPLVNVHDVMVVDAFRGRGVGQAMFAVAEREATARGACKLTLEVLSGNQPARRLYERMGFVDYQLSPEMGSACFMQRWLNRPVKPL